MMAGWTMSPEGWLWMTAWVVILVVAVWLLTRAPARRERSEEPLELLRSRLARGEISPEEFERARALLESSTKHAAR